MSVFNTRRTLNTWAACSVYKRKIAYSVAFSLNVVSTMRSARTRWSFQKGNAVCGLENISRQALLIPVSNSWHLYISVTLHSFSFLHFLHFNQFRITTLADLINHGVEIPNRNQTIQRHTENHDEENYCALKLKMSHLQRKPNKKHNTKACKGRLHGWTMPRLQLPHSYMVMQRGLAHCQGGRSGDGCGGYLHVEHHEFIGQTVSVLNINHLFVHQRLKRTAQRLETCWGNHSWW